MLTYLKVNDYVFNFKNGLNIIDVDDSIDVSNYEDGSSRANNLGKTMLVGIISRLHGEGEGFLPLEQSVISKINQNDTTVEIDWTFKVNNIEHKFSYITSLEKIIYKNTNELLSAKQYRNKIRMLLDNELFLVNEIYCVDTKFIQKSNSSDGFKSFFVNKSATYLALMLIILLSDDDESNFDNVHNYFLQVAKRNSYKRLERTYHGEMIDKIKENKSLKIKYKDYYKIEQEKRKLKKVEHDRIDEGLLHELNSLVLPIDFTEVKKFHECLVEDYNDLVDRRIKEIDKEIEGFVEDLRVDELNEYEAFEISMGSQILDYIDDLNDVLKQEFVQIEPVIEDILEKANKKMFEINKRITSVFKDKTDVYINNNFSKGRNKENVLETIKFNVQISGAGDGYRQVNYALLYANILEKSKLNIVVLDTMKTSEAKDLFEKMLLEIKNTVRDKQYIIITFEKVDKNKFYVCKSFKEPLLGFSF